MTPQPSEQPWTAAGKALLDLLYEEDSSFTAREVLHAIRAIEEEAMLRQLERSLQDEHATSVTIGEAAAPDPAPVELWTQANGDRDEYLRLMSVTPEGIAARVGSASSSAVAIPAPLDVWEWYGDWPEGVRHGAGEGWLHVHPDGTRWVHPEKACPLEGAVASPAPLDVERLAEAMAVNGISDGDGLPLFDIAEKIATEYARLVGAEGAGT